MTSDIERAEAAPYSGAVDFIADVLKQLDAALLPGVSRPEQDPGALPGLTLTEPEVRRLLAGSATLPRIGGSLWNHVAPRLEASRQIGLLLPLEIIRQRFTLSIFEIECLLVGLAPEADSKYERVFGYLNDDLTCKYPTVQLLLRLLAPEGEPPLHFRRYLGTDSSLIRAGLLGWTEPSGASHMSRAVRVETGVARFLLGELGLDPELEKVWLESAEPAEARELWDTLSVQAEIDTLLHDYFERRRDGERLICVLTGRAGSGRRHLVEAANARKGMGTVAIDCRRLLRHPQPDTVLRHAFRDSAINASPLLLAHADVIARDRERSADLSGLLERLVEERGWLLYLTQEEASATRDWFARHRVVDVAIPETSADQRAGWWLHLLTRCEGLRLETAVHLAESLSAKFRLTPGQIAAAFTRASSARPAPRTEDQWWSLFHGATAEVSAPRLGELAEKIPPLYRWNHLVLPPKRLELLRDIVRHVQFRRTVMDDWCFAGAMNRGRGINALFSGPSGTGKTMAAEVIACELGLNLYRIDLANVVSKYIGETEKNLARLFREAEHSDAILFFDEADALFGKRSEVRDAHDRYANIEINYLLQKMESFEGIAILATNLRQNLDEAFLRRIHIAVDFPMPTPDDRLRIWRGIFPAEAPCGPDLDFQFLARAFDLSGGNIRNIGLTAAYLAAEQGGAITMHHLVSATQRELEKIGKRAAREQFGPYYACLERPMTPPAVTEEPVYGQPH